ncbi:ATP-dependent helicase/deoxyribonuclease subunit B [Novipirellula aureliae]|uniref:ATP-dependent helicase/deoxyribonuclease subunit B n=1 Tax=Novipirellula aureliae TaxID=2527966 RepID=A0A5C6E6H8_9BACT|nr:PD-(D/E)XK nuclease family protein [Novipirellula aureliae]TWU43251.1 ATP-dependent helicase/deoxyribonuclease subunit B [Novipirellula aureliae]
MKPILPKIELEFVGWEKPLLPQVAHVLGKRFSNSSSSGELNLSDWICVLPTSYALDRFEKLLAAKSADSGWKLRKPECLTVGQLPEKLYRPKRPLAIEFEQTLAWSGVLANTPATELSPLVPTLPASEEIDSWMELAATLRGLHEDLASNRLTFLDVANVSESPSDQQRWKLLSSLCESYLKALQRAGLSDPHHERRLAFENNECKSDKAICLIGTSDLSKLQIAMLESMQGSILSFIAAPRAEAKRFDSLGCLVTNEWTDHILPLQDETLLPAGDIADQATAVAENLTVWKTDYPASSMTIGVTDDSQIGPVEFELRGSGIETFRHAGWTVNRTAIGRLVRLAAAFQNRPTWQSLATLVRHADVYDWLTDVIPNENASKSNWLTELDQLLSNHYPIELDSELPPVALKNYPQAIAVAKRVEQWLAPFADKNQIRPLARWCETISDWLDALYQTPEMTGRASKESSRTARSPMLPGFAGRATCAEAASNGAKTEVQSKPQASSRTSLALDSVNRLLKRFSEVNASLDFEVHGADALQMIASRISELRVSEPPREGDVKILGWLDLPLDDSEALVLVGLNHPFVPGAVTSDAFLPGTLRTQLRMSDNDRRYARDVYNLQLLLSTRKTIRFIVGRTSADGTPTPPSRLLAAASDIDVARRIRKMIKAERPSVAIKHAWDDAATNESLPIPKLPIAADGECVVKAMSVTAFRDYLACPYRFYLRHVLKLKPLDDSSSELAANQFGDLVHGALERFGDSPDRDEADPDKIEGLLHHHLHAYADEHYGSSVSTAVTLQIRQAERRLAAVAVEQAKRIAAGWRIERSEAPVDDKKMGACIEVDGFQMGLRGRLDRIDYHPATGRWAILDYKTHGHKPEKKHLKKTDDGYEWIDLQLPLYRMMIPYLGIDANVNEVELGYFNVSDKDAETKINVAEFDEALMEKARLLILDCVRRIRDGDFEPSQEPIEFDDYAMILQTGAM